MQDCIELHRMFHPKSLIDTSFVIIQYLERFKVLCLCGNKPGTASYLESVGEFILDLYSK